MTKDQWLVELAANEDDTHTRLVYADWLEEQGEAEEADRQRKWPAAKAYLKELAVKHWDWLDEGEDEDIDEIEEHDFYSSSYHRLMYFLERHVDQNYHLPFDTPYKFNDYSEEMWQHFSVITGHPVQTDTELPPFSCGC